MRQKSGAAALPAAHRHLPVRRRRRAVRGPARRRQDRGGADRDRSSCCVTGAIRHALIIAPKRVARDGVAGRDRAVGASCRPALRRYSRARRKRAPHAGQGRATVIMTIVGIDIIGWLLDELGGLAADHPLYRPPGDRRDLQAARSDGRARQGSGQGRRALEHDLGPVRHAAAEQCAGSVHAGADRHPR